MFFLVHPTGPHDTHPPLNIVVPDEPLILLPPGISCGRIIEVSDDGVIRSEGYPAHRHNQRCAYVLSAPEGYGFRFRFTNLVLDQRYLTQGLIPVILGGCTDFSC